MTTIELNDGWKAEVFGTGHNTEITLVLDGVKYYQHGGVCGICRGPKVTGQLADTIRTNYKQVWDILDSATETVSVEVESDPTYDKWLQHTNDENGKF